MRMNTVLKGYNKNLWKEAILDTGLLLPMLIITRRPPELTVPNRLHTV